MNSKPASRLKRPGEAFDLNTTQVAGVVQKLWPRSGDVYARLRISIRGHLMEEDDAQAIYVNLRFPMGQVNNQPITLQPGDAIRVSGFLTHNEYFETIHHFLQAAHADSFLEGVPVEDLSAWQAITFRRVNIMFNVRGLALLRPDGKVASGPQLIEEDELSMVDGKALNHVAVEGIVARRWEYADHLFMRLAVYDRFTPLERGGNTGNRGRPRRKPHYITVRFLDGKVAGRSVTVQLKKPLSNHWNDRRAGKNGDPAPGPPGDRQGRSRCSTRAAPQCRQGPGDPGSAGIPTRRSSLSCGLFRATGKQSRMMTIPL